MQSSAKHHFVLQWFYIEVFTWESCTDQTEPRSQSQRWLRSGWRTRWRPPRKPCHTADYEWSRSWTSCCRRLCVRQCWWPRRCNHLSLRSVSNSHSSRCCCTLTGLRRLVGGRELWESERKFLIFIYYHYFLCIWRPWSDFFHIKWLCTLGSEPIKRNRLKGACSLPCTSVSLYLTRLKMDVNMLAAVAALCWSHQRSRVWPATVKLYSTGGVVGGTGGYVSVLSRHLHSVETCSDRLSPGEIPFVGPTIHTSCEVGWLTRGWRRRKTDFRLWSFFTAAG